MSSASVEGIEFKNNNKKNQKTGIIPDIFSSGSPSVEDDNSNNNINRRQQRQKLLTRNNNNSNTITATTNSSSRLRKPPGIQIEHHTKGNKSESFLNPVMAAIHQKKVKEEEKQYDANEFGVPKKYSYTNNEYDHIIGDNQSRKGTLGISEAIVAISSATENDTNSNNNNGNGNNNNSSNSNSKKKNGSKDIKDNIKKQFVSESVAMLQQFVEGPIKFAPTYKFHKGTDMYNAKRVPAWCDRILWVTPSHPCITINQRVYASADKTPLVSDHRPVFSEFDIIHNASWNPQIGTEWMIKIRKLKLCFKSYCCKYK